MNRCLAAALAAALLLAGPGAATAAPQKTKSRFQVDGTSVILRQNLAAAQRRAVGAGLRKSVYQAVLQSMGEAAMVQFRSRIDGAILKEAALYVQSYRMLKHEVDEDVRLVKVGLEVVVDLSVVDEAIRSLQLARVKKGEIRLLFLVVEQIFRSGARGGREAIRLEGKQLGTAERRLMFDFARAGYTPVSPRARGRRSYKSALSSASGRLAKSLIPEVRRVFPPPPRPAGRGRALSQKRGSQKASNQKRGRRKLPKQKPSSQ